MGPMLRTFAVESISKKSPFLETPLQEHRPGNNGEMYFLSDPRLYNSLLGHRVSRSGQLTFKSNTPRTSLPKPKIAQERPGTPCILEPTSETFLKATN